jgi:hypothetical protein
MNETRNPNMQLAAVEAVAPGQGPARLAAADRLRRLSAHPAVEPLAVLGVSLLGLGLRLFRLGTWSFWGDEVFTLRFMDDGFRVPLSTALIHWLTESLGVSEWSARLGPALIGAATIPLLYYPVRRAFGRPVALVFSLLLAVSTWHLYWSQNVRFYTALLLLYTLALLGFHLALEEDRPLWMAGSLVCLGLAANERLLALFFAPIAALYVGLLYGLPRGGLGRPPGLRLRNLAVYLAPGVLGVAFFAGPYLLSLDDWVVNFGIVNNSPAWLAASTVYYLGLPVVVLGAFGGLHLLLARQRAGLLLGLAAGVPVAALMALSVVQYTASRYAFVALPAWLLLASVALVTLYQQAAGTGRMLAAGVLVLAVSLGLAENALYFTSQNGNRADARAAYQFIAARRAPADVVVGPDWPLGQYYLGSDVYSLATFDFSAPLPEGTRLWIVEDMNVAGVWPAQAEWIHANARLAGNFDVHAYARNFVMRVYVYSR